MNEKSEDLQSNVMDALSAGAALSDSERDVDGTPVAVLPVGYAVHELDHLLQHPARIKGTVKLSTPESFIDYVNDIRRPDGNVCRIYSDPLRPTMVAVINDHGDTAGWQDMRAVFTGQHSPEWNTWISKSGAKMTQADFAAFIEDNLPDIANPPAAHMLEVSRTLEAKKAVNFASGIRLSNGENQITYEETVSGTAGKGMLQIPEMFVIGIPVILGGPKYGIEARLRYRIGEGGKMSMWYELVRTHKIIEDALAELHGMIEAQTKIKPLIGTI